MRLPGSWTIGIDVWDKGDSKRTVAVAQRRNFRRNACSWTFFPANGCSKPCAVVVRRASRTLSFPLALVIASLPVLGSLRSPPAAAMKSAKTPQIHQVKNISTIYEDDMNGG
jgi:hypothetical protein